MLAFYEALVQRHAAAEVLLELREERRHQGEQQGQADGGEAVAGDESGASRFPPGDDRAGSIRARMLQEQGGGVYVAHVAAAGEGVDGVLRGDDFPRAAGSIRSSSRRGAGESGYGAVPGVRA